MLRLFRNNNPFTVLLLLILTLLLKLHVLQHPQMPVQTAGHFIFNVIVRGFSVLFNGNPFHFTLLAVIMIFMQAVYLNSIAERRKLFNRNNYFPAVTYVVITSVYIPFNYFNEALLINWALLGAIDILLTFSQTTQPQKQIFNASYLFCIAFAFWFSAIGYLLFLLIGLLLLRRFNFAEWIIAVVGYFTPIYFMACILFLLGKLPLMHVWVHTGFTMPGKGEALHFSWIAIVGMFILVICGLYAMLQQMSKNNIYVRRNWGALMFSLNISMPAAIFTGPGVPGAWLITMPVLALVISQALSLEKSKLFSSFVFYFSLILGIVCQFVLK